MIDPPLPSASCRAPTSRQNVNVPFTLVSMVCANISSGMRSGMMPVSAITPALLTRMSTRPNVAHDAITVAFTVAGSVTSHAWTSVFTPRPSTSLATSCSLSTLRAARTMLAPAPANVLAKPTPSPYEAPVMMAVLPFSENRSAKPTVSVLFFGVTRVRC